MIYPIFSSHYSRGRSILTLDSPERATDPSGPQSIIKLCLDNSIKDVFLLEDSLTGMREAYKRGEENDLKINFGWRVKICNSNDEGKDAKDSESKIGVFVKNTQGYYDLIKMHNFVQMNGGVLDNKSLNDYWTNNLILTVPFYDGYIFENHLFDKQCQVNFPEEPILWLEDGGLPFDNLVAIATNKVGGVKVKVKSILYENRSDFKAWMTYKCATNIMNMGKRRSIEMPNFDHCSSDEFCLESWKEKQ